VMRVAPILAIVAILGCGGAGLVTTPRNASAGLSISTVSGARVVALRRSTPGVVQLSLWIDAGSRDASPPQLAAVAAWQAAEQSGEGATGHALPDSTSIDLTCESVSIDACVRRLIRGLSTRQVDGLETTMAELRRRRRLAATDESRQADSLALRALLGVAASGFNPLGADEDDPRVTPDAVQRFLADHYGASRALIVAVGDVDAAALGEAVGEALEDCPPARAARGPRGLPVIREPIVEVEVGEGNTVSVATAAADLTTAAGLAAELHRGDGHEVSEMPLSVHAFEVRGGALLLARLSGADPADATRDLVRHLARVRAEGVAPFPLDLPEAPAEAAQRLGQAFGGGRGNPPRPVAAVGAVIAGGRGDAAANADPDAALRTRWAEILGTARAAGVSAATPHVVGDLGSLRASARTENGARIEVMRRVGDPRVAVAVRFRGGASGDPAELHGRTALLATLAVTACAGLGRGGLEARLDALGAELTPTVGSSGWGLVVSAPRIRWREALSIAVACALGPDTSPEQIERARGRHLDRLDEHPPAPWAGRALFPLAPGLVAPLGDSRAVRRLPTDAVARAAQESRVGARLTVAVVGDVPVREAVDRVARRIASLPRGEGPPGPQLGEPIADLGTEEWAGPAPRVVVAWRAADSGLLVPAGAAAFASTVGARLSRHGALRLVWAGGGAGPWGAWAAVALDVTEEALDQVPDQVAAALGDGLFDAVIQMVRAEARERALSQARGAVAAERLAAGDDLRDERAAARTARLLARSGAHFIVGRSTAPP